MWSTDSIWLEVAVVGCGFALGHIFFGLFEERTPRWRKFLKFVATMVLMLGLSHFLGRRVAFGVFGLLMAAPLFIHFYWLPKKHGINGWTGEPKSNYYDLRGWDKNIFGDEK